jgi:hypothetical protein
MNERQHKADALASYMTQAGAVPGFIACAPVMVECSLNTGIDCRLAPVIAYAESSCGRGSSDLFGTSSWGGLSYEEQVRRFYSRMREIANQLGTTDNWQLAYVWRGDDQGEAVRRQYCDNVVGTINQIGW